jgi:alanine racemase
VIVPPVREDGHDTGGRGYTRRVSGDPRAEVPTWIEIEADAIRHNLRLFRALVRPGTGVLAVVKANAYGHGIEAVARISHAEGVEMFGVHSADEVATLRKLGLGVPILAMGYLTPAQISSVVDEHVHVLLSSRQVLAALAAQAERMGCALPVHVKVDTGTHRQGVPPDEAAALAREARDRGLLVAGVATHFANIEDTTDHTYAFQQLDRFRAAVAAVREAVGEVPMVHAACSAAALLFREADFSLVRVGVSLYGHWPSRETYLSWLLAHGRDGIRLRPSLSWRARVGQLKEVPAGAPIGYGLTYRPTRLTRLAVLPVGYSEGLPRTLSNRARVLIRGCTAPVAGRVCMNITMVDVTDVPGVAEGDVATIIGADGNERVSVEELADLSGTINYEVLARLSPLLPRFTL